jgi:hypothetical protein
MSNQRSKAATKRARKKASRQQGQAPAETDIASAAQPVTASSNTAHADDISHSNMAAAENTSAEAAAAAKAADGGAGDGSGVAQEPLQQPPAPADRAAAQSDWWRCLLSGEVMRDPVLYGNGGHSFERLALEEWLASNPGVDLLSGQPLPPGGGGVLANHALRNMLQQLQLV